MLVFENRGAEVGATIAHPHGQIYAFDFVPELPLRELEHGTPFGGPGDRLVSESRPAGGPGCLCTGVSVRLAARARRAGARPSVARRRRSSMGSPSLVDVLGRLDRLFAAETPYMLWIHQRPFDGGDWPGARLHVEIVSPWRAPYVPRYVAAGELGSGVYFNPVAPEAAAEALREAAAVER